MIIVVGAEKGGVGKTLISTNIAALAASEGVEVCLMDTDPQGSATAWARIRRSQEGLTQFPVVTIPPDPLYELQTIAPKFDLSLSISARRITVRWKKRRFWPI
jgi:chromosome partitioning protein